MLYLIKSFIVFRKIFKLLINYNLYIIKFTKKVILNRDIIIYNESKHTGQVPLSFTYRIKGVY